MLTVRQLAGKLDAADCFGSSLQSDPGLFCQGVGESVTSALVSRFRARFEVGQQCARAAFLEKVNLSLAPERKSICEVRGPKSAVCSPCVADDVDDLTFGTRRVC